MSVIWVSICNASHAKLFEVRTDDPAWHSIDVERERSSHPMTDLPDDKVRSAGGVVRLLDRAIRANRFDHWLLAAPAVVSHSLHKELTPMLKKQLLDSVEGDLTQLTVTELSARLAPHLQISADKRKTVREPDGRG